MRSLLSLTSLSLLVLPTVAQTGIVGTCYLANGTALPTDPIYNQYQPCQSGGPSTICCGIFRDNVAGGNITAGDTMDECLPNGLCQNRATTTDGVEETKFFVDFCADDNIDSPNCLNVCDQVRDSFGIARITPCDTGRADSDRWCCGDSTACCTSNVGVVKLPQIMGAAVSSSRAGLPTTAPVSKVSSASTASTPTMGTEAPNKSPSAAVGNTGEDPSVTGGVIAGIVISGVIGLALLAAAVFFARRASKYKREAAASKYAQDIAGCLPQNPDQGQMSDYQKYMHDSQHTYSSAQPSELPPAPPSELPSFQSPPPGTTLAQQ
ncbi:hypothetical protein AA0111_g11360 [Alternaria arborescens]|uniref:hypothetical protein n=1 Tax=Alternaria arborescens TaxID=156630 RepID=UPI001074B560|nr:hypothetical protein AA0111_g11360 [Alternaria arborescens]RYO16594.1 hypothetical protein AA0111_g11360 [Alternaria arborescens]